VRAFLGLGANLGDREAALRGAVAALAAEPGVRPLRCSSLYETAPQGRTDQPWFLNCVLAVDTDLGPEGLLRACQRVEAAFGRTRAVRWGPRTLDVDLLLYDDAVLAGEGLAVPHPRMHLRAFVLVPLHEIAPDAVIPGRGPVAALLPAVADQAVRRVAGPPPLGGEGP
jgi:2-amino-4-hydroxy-6-hydroxymethyldihydropteridine diphosphokinase